MKGALIALILIDAVLTYAAVVFLGACEILLVFINQVPPAAWAVAAVKVLAVFYVDKMAKKYALAKHILSAAATSHLIRQQHVLALRVSAVHFP